MLGEYFRANRHCAGLGSSAAPSRPAAVGVLRHAKPSGGVSPACRRLGWRHSPRLVAARLRLEMVWPPKLQTTSPTTAHLHRFSPRWSAIWAKRSGA